MLAAQDPIGIYQKILNGKFSFSKAFDKHARGLVPGRRAGGQAGGRAGGRAGRQAKTTWTNITT